MHDCANFHTFEGKCTLCGSPQERDSTRLADPDTEYDRYQASPCNIMRRFSEEAKVTFDLEREMWKHEFGADLHEGPRREGERIPGPSPEPDFENPTWATMMQYNIGTPEQRYRQQIVELTDDYNALEAEYEALHWQYIEKTGERP